MVVNVFFSLNVLLHSYLPPPQSLGKAQTAAVKRDAEIGVAQVSFFQTNHNIGVAHLFNQSCPDFSILILK